MIIRSLIALAIGACLASCSIARVNQSMDKVDQNAERAKDLDHQIKTTQVMPPPAVIFSDSQWVNPKPLPMPIGLPQSEDCDITWNTSASIMRFAQIITGECGVRVRVTPDVLTRSGRSSKNQSKGTSTVQPAIFPVGNQASYGQIGASGEQRLNYITGIKFSGRLSDLLDQVTARLGLSWVYNPTTDRIRIYYLDTRTYRFFTFASDTEMKSVVQSGTTSEAGQGDSSGSTSDSGISGFSGSSQSTSVDMKTSIIDDINNSIDAMLSDDGYMSISPSIGVITVTDRADVLNRVGRFVKRQNDSLTKQVLLNVKVYAVTLKDSDSTGIDWNAVRAGSDVKFSLNNSSGVDDSGVVSGQIGILSGPWQDTTAIVRALSKQGRVSVVTSPSVTTLNLQPVPVQVARQTGYLARSEVTSTANVGSTKSYIPGTVTSGFNMSLLPYIINKKELLLRYSINISSLVSLRTIGDDSNKIEVPEIDNRIFAQNARLNSGETLILAGFDQKSENANKSGVGSPSNMLFGGSATRESTRDVIVVLITPIIKE